MHFYIYASLGLKELNPASTPDFKSTYIDNWMEFDNLFFLIQERTSSPYN